MSSYFGEKGHILKFLKPKATPSLWLTNIIPANQGYISLSPLGTLPQKFSCFLIKAPKKDMRDLVGWHSIDRDDLNDRFYKCCYIGLRNIPSHPTFKMIIHLSFFMFKAIRFLPKKRGISKCLASRLHSFMLSMALIPSFLSSIQFFEKISPNLWRFTFCPVQSRYFPTHFQVPLTSFFVALR